MDESVIFVEEIRARDSDVIFLDRENTDQVASIYERSSLHRQCRRYHIPIINVSSNSRRKLHRLCKQTISLMRQRSASGTNSESSEVIPTNTFEATNVFELDESDDELDESDEDFLEDEDELFNTELKTKEKETEPFKLECPICLESLENLVIQITNCGHLFCKNCLDVIKGKPRPTCPKCRKGIVKRQIRPVFL